MHSVLLALLALLGVYLLQCLLQFRRAIHSIGYPSLYHRKNDITESHCDSHLSGPRELINPSSALAQLIRLALPPFRFVIRENSWLFRNGYKGRGMPPV
jgi:hypothetical protein